MSLEGIRPKGLVDLLYRIFGPKSKKQIQNTLFKKSRHCVRTDFRCLIQCTFEQSRSKYRTFRGRIQGWTLEHVYTSYRDSDHDKKYFLRLITLSLIWEACELRAENLRIHKLYRKDILTSLSCVYFAVDSKGKYITPRERCGLS